MQCHAVDWGGTAFKQVAARSTVGHLCHGDAVEALSSLWSRDVAHWGEELVPPSLRKTQWDS